MVFNAGVCNNCLLSNKQTLLRLSEILDTFVAKGLLYPLQELLPSPHKTLTFPPPSVLPYLAGVAQKTGSPDPGAPGGGRPFRLPQTAPSLPASTGGGGGGSVLLGLITVMEMWLVVLKVMTPRREWRKGKVRRRRRKKEMISLGGEAG